MHIKGRSKLDKLVPKAYISYLVGYELTNIFRIWLLSQKRVISLRDVVFDSTRRYDPREEIPTVEDRIIELIELLELNVD